MGSIDKLMNEKVYSETYGIGIITEIDYSKTPIKIKVQFDNNKTLQFLYPNVFKEKKLFPHSAGISKLMDYNTCQKCGRIVGRSKLKEYEGILCCPQCYPVLKTCDYCHRSFLADDIIGMYKVKVCKHCYSKHFYKCKECGNDVDLHNKMQYEYFDKMLENQLCSYCTQDLLSYCACCDKYVDSELINLGDTYAVCKECYDNKRYQCEECGSLVRYFNRVEGLCSRCWHARFYVDDVVSFFEQDLEVVQYSFSQIKEMRHEDLMGNLRVGERWISRTEKVPFDVLQIVLTEWPLRICLIVNEHISSHAEEARIGSCTMTEFKKNYALFWRINRQKHNEIIRSIPLDDNKELKIYKYPIYLRAMTSLDKDYRKEWHNDVLVYEGNNFGDTSDFYVVGEINGVYR